jgi:hypothetical protein
MPFDFTRVAFGCVRDPARVKTFRQPGVSAVPLPESWGRNGWPIVLGHNDTIGTCVPTAACNAVMPLRWESGNRTPISNDVPVQIYSTVGPYRGTPETDIGMDPITLFDWWLHNPIGGYVLESWFDVDPFDELMVRQTIRANGSIFAVQKILAPQETQRIWTPAGGVEKGLHATSFNRFDGELSWSACWGKEQGVDEDFISGPGAQVLDMYGLNLVRA